MGAVVGCPAAADTCDPRSAARRWRGQRCSPRWSKTSRPRPGSPPRRWQFERALGDPERLGKICLALALAAGYRTDPGAERWSDEARLHFIEAGLPVGSARPASPRAPLHVVSGELEAAAEKLARRRRRVREHDDHLGLILAVSRLGEVAWRQGDIALFAEMHAELLELGRSGRSTGVIAGATARLALARLELGDVDEAQSLARDALAFSSESFMPVVNGYAFKTAGLVNLRLGHVSQGRAQLRAAIEAFEQGAGSVGLGQAAMCWVDLSNSLLETGETAQARRAAETAVEVAVGCGDPWVRAQSDAHLAIVNGGSDLVATTRR